MWQAVSIRFRGVFCLGCQCQCQKAQCEKHWQPHCRRIVYWEDFRSNGPAFIEDEKVWMEHVFFCRGLPHQLWRAKVTVCLSDKRKNGLFYVEKLFLWKFELRKILNWWKSKIKSVPFLVTKYHSKVNKTIRPNTINKRYEGGNDLDKNGWKSKKKTAWDPYIESFWHPKRIF